MKKTQMGAVIIVFTSIVVLMAAALVSGIGFSLAQVRRTFGALDPQTAIFLGTACLSVFLASWLVAAAIRRGKEREVAAIASSNLRHIYAAVLESLATNPGEAGPALPAVQGALALLASIPVLKEYQATIHVLCAPDSTEDDMRQQIGRLILAMRRDLGVSTLGLQCQDCLDWLSWGSPAPTAGPPAPPAAPDWLTPAHRLFPET